MSEAGTMDIDKAMKKLQQLSDEYFATEDVFEQMRIRGTIRKYCELNNLEPLTLCPCCNQFSTENDYGCCNMCGEYEEQEIPLTEEEKEANSKRGRTTWSNRDIKGFIAETWVATQLRNSGAKVSKIAKYDEDEEKIMFDKKRVGKLLAGHPDKRKIINHLSGKQIGLPDLIARQGKDVSFVEVKSNTSEVKPHQKEVLDGLKEMGYAAYTKRVEVDFSVKEVNEIPK